LNKLINGVEQLKDEKDCDDVVYEMEELKKILGVLIRTAIFNIYHLNK
jgi:hypothetical protein